MLGPLARPCGRPLTGRFCRPSSKALKPQPSPGVFGALQNFKEDKPQPVRDEYEYVSDDGELKIDEFPIRRKKNAPKRDLSCEWGDVRGAGPAPKGPSWACAVGIRRGRPGAAPPKAAAGRLSALLPVLLDKKEALPTPVTKPKLDSALYKVSALG